MLHFDWIKRHAERTPDKLALVDAHTGRTFSYAQFNERANRLASFSQNSLRIERGDRVSALAQNSSDYYEVLFACSKADHDLSSVVHWGSGGSSLPPSLVQQYAGRGISHHLCHPPSSDTITIPTQSCTNASHSGGVPCAWETRISSSSLTVNTGWTAPVSLASCPRQVG